MWRDLMKKALSRNPNMLRTMIGLGLVLILVLSYAVYSNTIDSEYYRYDTSNGEEILVLTQPDENLSAWQVTTNAALTWVNVTVLDAPIGSQLVMKSSSSIWYHSPLLGLDGDSAFNCKEFSDVAESCIAAYTHSIDIVSAETVLRGRVSLELPIEGVGFLQADDILSAEERAEYLISSQTKLTTWEITIVDDDEVISSVGLYLQMTVTSHNLITVTEFSLDPVTEAFYGVATLIGCFSLLLVLPMIAYFAGVYKSQRDESLRSQTPPPSV
jgi:hypothetical protein|tara:strand:+ start:5106 stop:5918 length:813 start_codon:yes stop_codon:yes gene_type:complete